jgi:hypothetical protein
MYKEIHMRCSKKCLELLQALNEAKSIDDLIVSEVIITDEYGSYTVAVELIELGLAPIKGNSKHIRCLDTPFGKLEIALCDFNPDSFKTFFKGYIKFI